MTARRIHRRVLGDEGPPVVMTLRIDGLEDLDDLNESQSSVIIWRRRATPEVLPGTTIVTSDSATNEVTIDIGAWLTDATWVGDWKIAVQGIFAGEQMTSDWDVVRLGAAG